MDQIVCRRCYRWAIVRPLWNLWLTGNILHFTTQQMCVRCNSLCHRFMNPVSAYISIYFILSPNWKKFPCRKSLLVETRRRFCNKYIFGYNTYIEKRTSDNNTMFLVLLVHGWWLTWISTNIELKTSRTC